jgi:acetyltransferase-like isoleucine patch superfamily enzyme
MVKKIFSILIILFPWPLRRKLLIAIWKYDIHPTAKIGLSYIYPDKLKMEENTRIGHFNVAIHLHSIQMKKDATISQRNWITGFPLHGKRFFEEFHDRKPQLIMGKDSAITKKHLVDCTDSVFIGEYTSVGGYGTQILSHSTSLEFNRQSCAPIHIGHHCFVGTRSIILPGSVLPDQSVLAAGAVLQKKFTENFALYGGVPAKFVKKMDESYAFFRRTYRPK